MNNYDSYHIKQSASIENNDARHILWLICRAGILLSGIFVGSGCTEARKDYGQAYQIIHEFLDKSSASQISVLVIDNSNGEKKWLHPSKPKPPAPSWNYLDNSIEYVHGLDTATPPLDNEQDLVCACMDICWIVFQGTRESLTVTFCGSGFSVGISHRHRFNSPDLAKALRETFEANDMMKGSRGRCLDSALKAAAGQTDESVAEPTEEELEEEEELDRLNNHGLKYRMQEESLVEGRATEMVMLAETKALPREQVNQIVDKDVRSTRLHVAADAGYWAVAKELMLKGADPNAANILGQTPLHIAAAHGDFEIVALLLLKGADPNTLASDWGSDERIRPLHFAVESGSLETVRLLVRAGADVNGRSEKSAKTPLVWAGIPIRYEIQWLISKFLCDNGADVNAKDAHGATALFYESQKDNQRIAKYLISKGATADIFSTSALGMVDRVDEILRESPSLAKAATYERQKQPLHLAAEKGHMQVARLLIEKGVDVNARTERGDQPLHFAAGGGHMQMASMLIDKGADVNSRIKSGETSLHLALYNRGNISVVELLIGKGADVNAEDNSGKTPLDVAIHNYVGREEEELLRKHGARPGKEEKQQDDPG